MGVWDVLFNAAGGGILGSALHVFTDWMDTKNKVTLLNAQMNAAEKTEAWKAFTSSQQDTGIKTIPDRAPVWVLSVYLLVQALKEAIRPLAQGSGAAQRAVAAAGIQPGQLLMGERNAERQRVVGHQIRACGLQFSGKGQRSLG